MLNGELVRRIDDAIAAFERANGRLADLVRNNAAAAGGAYSGAGEAAAFGIWLRSTPFPSGSRDAQAVRRIRPLLASYERAIESVISYTRRGVPSAAQFIFDGELATLFDLLCEAMLDWRKDCMRASLPQVPATSRIALAC